MRLVLTIILNFVIVLLIGVLIYVGLMVFRAYSKDETAFGQFIEPAYLLSLININNNDKWQVFDSITYSFEHPASWKPTAKNGQANSLEVVDLRIPVIFSLPRMGSVTTAGYFRDPITKMRPTNILKEEQIVFAGRQGFKWIYKKDDNYVVYLYAISLSEELSSARQSTTFAIMVEAARSDTDLENLLDRLSQSVVLKEN